MYRLTLDESATDEDTCVVDGDLKVLADGYVSGFLSGAKIDLAPRVMGENLMVKGSSKGGASGPLLTP